MRDVTVSVPDAEAYDTVVVIVPIPKGVIKGVEHRQGLADALVGACNDRLTRFVQENGIVFTGVNRQGKWV